MDDGQRKELIRAVLKYAIPLLLASAALISGAAMTQKAGHENSIDIYVASTGRVEKLERIQKTDEQWRELLTPEQYRVTRQKGTEPPFAGKCDLPAKGVGFYQCVCCGTDLFKSDSKFDSGTGWPSFWDPVSELNIRLEPDDSHGMFRTEARCARCGAHLGHVFDDGPPPTGKRYCINAVALKLAEPALLEKATFAAGCFWGVESAFRELLGKGVVATRVGYTGGNTKNPTYESVCSHTTGHAEAVEVTFDPAKIGYEQLLDLFWEIHDPTTLNRQGPDIGDQYRSAIFYHGSEQKRLAEQSKARLGESKKADRPVVTQIVPAPEFYPAEDYHQNYFEKRGIKPTCHVR